MHLIHCNVLNFHTVIRYDYSPVAAKTFITFPIKSVVPFYKEGKVCYPQLWGRNVLLSLWSSSSALCCTGWHPAVVQGRAVAARPHREEGREIRMQLRIFPLCHTVTIRLHFPTDAYQLDAWNCRASFFPQSLTALGYSVLLSVAVLGPQKSDAHVDKADFVSILKQVFFTMSSWKHLSPVCFQIHICWKMSMFCSVPEMASRSITNTTGEHWAAIHCFIGRK